MSELRLEEVCAVAATGADALVAYAHIARAHALLFCAHIFCPGGAPV
jgi:hypothetical protein